MVGGPTPHLSAIRLLRRAAVGSARILVRLHVERFEAVLGDEARQVLGRASFLRVEDQGVAEASEPLIEAPAGLVRTGVLEGGEALDIAPLPGGDDLQPS